MRLVGVPITDRAGRRVIGRDGRRWRRGGPQSGRIRRIMPGGYRAGLGYIDRGRRWPSPVPFSATRCSAWKTRRCSPAPGKYVDDLREENMAHVVFVRSHVAHGTITSVDVSRGAGDARRRRRVLAADGNDLGLPSFQGFPMMPAEVNRPIFAKDKVRFVGDIVAAVVAETREQAIDAADAVVVDYDPLPVVTTAAAALAARRAAPLPRARIQRLLRHHVRRRRRRPRGRRRRRRGDDGQPAPGRRADGVQRHRGRPRRAQRRAHVLGVAPGAALRPRRDGPAPRPRARAAARRLPVGRRWLRPEGRRVRRVPRRRGGRAAPSAVR